MKNVQKRKTSGISYSGGGFLNSEWKTQAFGTLGSSGAFWEAVYSIAATCPSLRFPRRA